jgi:uncharacterized NAD-dependent epimerase/dehydratase family protein
VLVQLKKPYLVFLGDVDENAVVKTGQGLVDWCPSDVLGQLRLPGCRMDLNVPDLSIAEAVEQGARSLVIGIAPDGGRLQESWIESLALAARSGLDVVSGLHNRLEYYEPIRAAAEASGATLINVRAYVRDFHVGNGVKRTGKRVLTVGTDCALGKKYTAMTLTRALVARGVDATFRATGQTGIMISGSGIPIDAMIGDFISGAAEHLSPNARADHWDVIEGQGSLFHPSYAAVTLGLVHGSQPDAMILCHDPSRKHIDGHPDFPLPALPLAIRRYEEAAQMTNPNSRAVGLSFNTSKLDESAARMVMAEASEETGLPCTDPVRFGADVLADAVTGTEQ